MLNIISNQQAMQLLFRTFARSLPDTDVFVYDHTLRLLFAEGRALLPRESTQLEGLLLMDVLPAYLTTEELLLQYQRAFEGVEISREYSLASGRFLVRSLPVRDESGAIIGGMTITRSIETQVSVEEALRYSERRTRTLLRTLPDALFVITSEGIFTQAHYGHQQHDDMFNVVGQHILDIPLPLEVARQALNAIKTACETQSMQIYNYAVPSEHGLVHYEARVSALSRDEALVLVRDVTTLKQTQEELQRHISDLELMRLFDNELAEQLKPLEVMQITLDILARLTNAELGAVILCDHNNLTLAHHIGTLDVHAASARLAKSSSFYKQHVNRNEARLILAWSQEKKGVPLQHHSRASMLLPLVYHERRLGLIVLETQNPQWFTTKNYEVAQLLAMRAAVSLENARLYDKTEQQLRELRELYEHVRQLEQLKTDMIRIASHDLKNPLAGVLGYVEMLRRSGSAQFDEAQMRYLANIEEGTRRMQRMVSGILSLERIEQMARQQLNERVQLDALIAQEVADFQARAEQNQQSLTADLAPVPLWVRGDAFQLREALRNLLSNALKYTPSGGRVRVEAQAVAGMAQVRVHDNGFGVPEAMQKQLFKPFYRARTSETANIEGLGLGLHLVKNIVERHHGKMFVHSVYGEGSSFGFDLPLLENPAQNT